MDERPKKVLQERIRRVFLDNFRRTLNSEEIDEIFESMIHQTKEELSKISDIQEGDVKKYFETDKMEIVFSPKQINKEILLIIKKNGLQALEESKEYKRLSEMNDASCLSLVLKKVANEEWFIKAQDNPDILLVKRNGEKFNKKPFNAINLEIMQIPQQEKDKMNQNKIEQEIAQFIANKKFLKRYGKYSYLLVHINFTHEQLKLGDISNAIRNIPGNPFHQIWVRATIDPNFSKMVLVKIHPNFFIVEFDFEKDSQLYF